jgi:hypothetical protein
MRKKKSPYVPSYNDLCIVIEIATPVRRLISNLPSIALAVSRTMQGVQMTASIASVSMDSLGDTAL